MVTISCKLVQRLKEFLPRNPTQGQVELFLIPMEKDLKIRYAVFEFNKNKGWILNIAE